MLTDDRGLDGFTMEELAESAGVSRRTLSNYFPGKRDAVLATPPPELSEGAHDRFLLLTGHIVEQIRVREGATFDARRAHVAIRLLCALFDSAFEIFLDDPEDRPITTAYDVLRTARHLLA